MLGNWRWKLRVWLRARLYGPTCLGCGHSLQNHQWVAYGLLCFEEKACRSCGPCAFREEIQ